MEKKKIGLVIAVEIEAFEAKYGAPDTIIDIHGQQVRKFVTDTYELYAIKSGAGEIAAASATQLLICAFDVDMILNFGIVGGLTEEVSRHGICVVKQVVHYDFDLSACDPVPPCQYYGYDSIYIPANEELLEKALKVAPDLMPVTCASGDKFVDGGEPKRRLNREYGADICEMEAAAIFLTCDRNGIPCLSIKMVSDGVTGGADEFRARYMDTSSRCLEVLDRIIPEL